MSFAFLCRESGLKLLKEKNVVVVVAVASSSSSFSPCFITLAKQWWGKKKLESLYVRDALRIRKVELFFILFFIFGVVINIDPYAARAPLCPALNWMFERHSECRSTRTTRIQFYLVFLTINHKIFPFCLFAPDVAVCSLANI